MEDLLTHEMFAKNLHTRFQAQVDEGNSVELELGQVSELKVYPQQEEFAIVFDGPNEAFLGQGIHTLSHAQMGQFQIFLVPIAQDEKGFHYEAVFNRVTTPSSAAAS